MKNKRVLIPIALFILAVVGISFFGGPLTYVFFWTVLLIPPVCFLYILLVIHSIKIYQRTEGRDMVCGTPSDFYITLQNEGWFSFSSVRIIFYSSFSSISEIDDGAVYELPPKSSIQRKTKLLCRYRGEYCVGIKQIVVKDFLGLFSVTYRIKEPLSVIVSPAIVHLPSLSDKEMFADSDRDNLQKKPVPDIPVREYMTGDEMRFINWKASAIMQKLMVRERHGEDKSGVAILMDPGRYTTAEEKYLPAENKIIEQVIALSLYYATNNIPADVIYKTSCTCRTAVSNIGDFEGLYEAMRKYSFRDDGDVAPFLVDLYESGELYDYRLLILVLQKWTTEEFALVEKISNAGMPIRVYVIDDEAGEEKTASDNRTEMISLDTRSYTEVAS